MLSLFDMPPLLAADLKRLVGDNHPVTGRPKLKAPGGKVATEESITVTHPRLNAGRPTNIPSIWGGARPPFKPGTPQFNDWAVDQALRSGQKFQPFDSIDAAVKAAKERSDMLDRTMGGDTGMFGFAIRERLFPKEEAFFKANPKTTGMAADDGRVILNPYSTLTPQERQSVAKNEAFRLALRKSGAKPRFSLTPEQKAQFKGSAYEADDMAQRETIAGRIYSGDPSAKAATPEQKAWVAEFGRWFAQTMKRGKDAKSK